MHSKMYGLEVIAHLVEQAAEMDDELYEMPLFDEQTGAPLNNKARDPRALCHHASPFSFVWRIPI
jgi:hypothetical protein